MDITQGLPENLEIEWRGRRLIQSLDYMRVPFRCNICHSTAHLRRDCKGPVETELEPEEPYPDYITQDTSTETGFYGTGLGPSA